MTIEKARKILGNFAQSLSNEEIQEIIDCFHGVIEAGIRQFERKHKMDPGENLSNRKDQKQL